MNVTHTYTHVENTCLSEVVNCSRSTQLLGCEQIDNTKVKLDSVCSKHEAEKCK